MYRIAPEFVKIFLSVMYMYNICNFLLDKHNSIG